MNWSRLNTKKIKNQHKFFGTKFLQETQWIQVQSVLHAHISNKNVKAANNEGAKH